MSNRILIGKISSAHGIKGLVKIFPMCEDISLLNGPLFTSEDGPETLNITLKNQLGKFVLAAVEGINDRNGAEILKTPLYISREALPEEDDGEYYFTDLIGLDVCNSESQKIGTVKAADNFGASDLIEIQPLAGKAFYIPFTDDYVLDVDIETRIIRVGNIDDFRED